MNGEANPMRQNVTDDLAMKIGEVVAYIHENRHGVNNLSSKFDGFTIDLRKQLAALETKLGNRVEEIERTLRAELVAQNIATEAKLTAANMRIAVLEQEKYRRDGASTVIASIMRSPTLGWMVGAAVTAWGLLSGKVHL